MAGLPVTACFRAENGERGERRRRLSTFSGNKNNRTRIVGGPQSQVVRGGDCGSIGCKCGRDNRTLGIMLNQPAEGRE